MIEKVYLDSDIIIDFFYERKNFYKESAEVIANIENSKINGYVSSLIVWNIYYLLNKFLGENEARQKIRKFRLLVNIISVDEKIIDLALNSNIKDFEDSIQYYAAKSKKIDIFLTRNKKDYPKNDISIMDCKEYLIRRKNMY